MDHPPATGSQAGIAEQDHTPTRRALSRDRELECDSSVNLSSPSSSVILSSLTPRRTDDPDTGGRTETARAYPPRREADLNRTGDGSPRPDPPPGAAAPSSTAPRGACRVDPWQPGYAGRCILRMLAFSKTMRTTIVDGTYGLTGDICRPTHLVVSKKTPILIRESALTYSRLPPLRTGTDDRGPEDRAHVGASDLQASPPSEKHCRLWGMCIKKGATLQGSLWTGGRGCRREGRRRTGRPAPR